MIKPTLMTGGRAAALAALIFMLPTVAPAQTVENPPTFNAGQIAGIQPVGSNYTIQNPVRSDGMLRVYNLTTPYGKFLVRGDAMMRMRINELKALEALQKVSNSDTFGKALVQAGLSPVKYTGKLITNPVGTVKGTLSGVGAFFDRLAAGAAAQGQTPDKPMQSLLGVTDARRKLAARYGVDPYTDFPPLDAALKRLAEASTAGGLVVTGALMAVPGAAGVIVSNLSTANTLNDVAIDQLARSYTAAQILALNRKRLLAMKVPTPVIDKLLANRDFTPIDMAAMVAALDSMKRVRDREIFRRPRGECASALRRLFRAPAGGAPGGRLSSPRRLCALRLAWRRSGRARPPGPAGDGGADRRLVVDQGQFHQLYQDDRRRKAGGA